MKRRGDRIVMITAYDAPSGRIADAAGVDLILVGDSAAMVMLGHDSTVPATMDEMIILTRAVNRGARRPLVVADLPFGSFQVSDEQALENAIRFVKEASADAVKLEGAGRIALARARDHGRRHAGDGPHRPDPADGDDARRLQGAGTDGRAGGAALRGRARAPGGRLLRDRARSRAHAGRGGDHASARHPDDRHRRGRLRATARCSCGTTCSGSTTGHAPRFVKQYAELAPMIQSAVARVRRRGAQRVVPGGAAHLCDPRRGACALRGLAGGGSRGG